MKTEFHIDELTHFPNFIYAREIQILRVDGPNLKDRLIEEWKIRKERLKQWRERSTIFDKITSKKVTNIYNAMTDHYD